MAKSKCYNSGMGKFVKIAVYVPAKYADKIRDAMHLAGCGQIGNYDYCSFSVKGVGRYRGGKMSGPFIGKSGRITKVAEERIETICPKAFLKKALAEIKKVHPYEEPAIDVYPLLNKFIAQHGDPK